MIKNITNIAKQTQTTIASDPGSHVDLYYSFKDKAAYTSPGDGRIFVTKLINPNTAGDIEETINMFLAF